jgi:hypothetical protein
MPYVADKPADLDVVLRDFKERFELLQQQLGIIERQLDGITILVNRAFTASLSPEAKDAERKRAIELAGKLAAEAEEKIQDELRSRAARGIPDDGDAVTEEDIRAAENESLLG